jgi:hypothetical protein
MTDGCHIHVVDNKQVFEEWGQGRLQDEYSSNAFFHTNITPANLYTYT